MKKVLLMFLLWSIATINFSQLNCKTTTDKIGNTTATCYHKNGKPSSIQIWDKLHRTGTMKCYTNTGKEIINYGLRHFAGHASVYLDYYANGQIKKAEYSEAPDAGIQFYRNVYKFDEAGNQTDFQDYSQPNGHPQLIMKFDTNNPYLHTTKPIIKKQEVIACATPFITTYKLVNETKNKITVLLKAQKNNLVQLRDTTILLKSKQLVVAKTVMLAQMFLQQHQGYDIEIAGNSSKKTKHKIIASQPIETAQNKTYTWHILKQ